MTRQIDCHPRFGLPALLRPNCEQILPGSGIRAMAALVRIRILLAFDIRWSMRYDRRW